METLMSIKQASEYLHVSQGSLRKWDKLGRITTYKTDGGHRRYRQDDLDRFVGIKTAANSTNKNNTVAAIYARVSSADQKQRGDTDRQSARIFEHCVTKGYKVEHIIKDLGSGLNDKRKGFVKLCQLVIDRKIDRVVIEHKDRLTRFQYNLIERFFNSYGVEIEVIDNNDTTEEAELVSDMMMLIASFSGRLYSARARENRKNKIQK